MRAELGSPDGHGCRDLFLDDVFAARLDEHGQRDLEFVLAQARAMSKRCPHICLEHTCALAPGHGQAHQCRACTFSWSGSTMG